jgi:hypothetical protein
MANVQGSQFSRSHAVKHALLLHIVGQLQVYGTTLTLLNHKGEAESH